MLSGVAPDSRIINIKCLDDAGKIIFDTVKSKLEGDYIFRNGCFEFDYHCDIKGEYTFSYQSTKVSTINNCSTLSFFPGSRFSYVPLSESRNLISM